MKEAFKFTVIRRQEALNILLACFLPFFFVMWLTGQFFPLKQEQLALWISFITVCIVCGASYWLIRRKALDVLKVELSSESFLVIHSSGQMTHLPLASIVKYRYFVTRGTHNILCSGTACNLVGQEGRERNKISILWGAGAR